MMIDLNTPNMFDNTVLAPVYALRESDAPAFYIKKKMWSYAEFWRCVSHQHNAIKEIDASNIGIYAANDIMTYASIVALWTLGKAYVPLNPLQPINRHQEVAESVGMTHVISPDAKYDIGIPGIRMVYTSADSVGNDLISANDFIRTDDSAYAYIIFTSGSTGKPKGVPINRGNLAAFVDSMDGIGLDITSEDRCLQPFDLTFDFSVSSYVIPLVKGASIYTVPQKGVKYLQIAGLIENQKLTVLQMVPSMMRNLLPYIDEIDLSCVRFNIFCGEALLGKHISRWHHRNPGMVSYNMYGPTEDTVFCTCYIIDKSNVNNILTNNDIVSIGTTFRNSGILLVDDSCNVIKDVDSPAELCLSGSQLTPGYWKNDMENAARFFDFNGIRYYRSGDLCFYASDGNLMYVGRKDFQVKINGFRVELGEIERTYSEISGGRYCVVMPFQNEQNNTELAIVIEGEEYDWIEDKKVLSDRLPKYEIPTKWVFVRAIPLNQNGKVDRNRLKDYL